MDLPFLDQKGELQIDLTDSKNSNYYFYFPMKQIHSPFS